MNHESRITNYDSCSRPTPKRLNYQLCIVCVLLLALAIRAVWVEIFPVDPIAPVDAEGFHLLATNVLTGQGFAIGWEPPLCPTAVRTPFYPLFLMASYTLMDRGHPDRISPDPTNAVLMQLLLEVITTALVIRLGRDLGDRRVALLAGLLYALNGTTQRYTGYLLAEVLLLPLLTTALLINLRYLRRPSARDAALSGLFWGLSLLTKPNVQFLALAIGVLVTSDELRVKSCELRVANYASRFTFHVSRFTFPLFWLTLTLVLLPWLIRGRVVFGRWMLSTAFEENLARVSAVATLAEVEGVRAEPWTATWEYYYDRLFADVGARSGWREIAASRESCAEVQLRQTQIAQAAREIVLAHPWAYVWAHVRGVLGSILDPGHRTWYRVLTGRDWETTGIVSTIWPRIAWSLERGAVGDALHAFWLERIVRPPLAAALIWWGLVVARAAVWVFAVRGIRHLRHRLWARWVLILSIAYLVALPGPIAYDRFYVPAIPVVVLLVALGVRGIAGENWGSQPSPSAAGRRSKS